MVIEKEKQLKVGTVALVGRPNTGKSTLVNAIVGQKVAITSPKPQTTQFPIHAVYEDARGQIIFVDTPGIFAKTKDPKNKEVNMMAEHSLSQDVQVVVYMVDHTRERGVEENRVLGVIRKVDIPKILVINKIDKREPSFREQYKFLESEFDLTIEISARTHTNINQLIDVIFDLLPTGEKLVETKGMALPVLDMSSTLYLEEMIREKAFLRLRREVPYAVRVRVDEIVEKPQKNLTVIKARILTPPRYKKMIIGEKASKIKEIGMMVRRELEIASGRKIYLELSVENEE